MTTLGLDIQTSGSKGIAASRWKGAFHWMRIIIMQFYGPFAVGGCLLISVALSPPSFGHMNANDYVPKLLFRLCSTGSPTQDSRLCAVILITVIHNMDDCGVTGVQPKEYIFSGLPGRFNPFMIFGSGILFLFLGLLLDDHIREGFPFHC